MKWLDVLSSALVPTGISRRRRIAETALVDTLESRLLLTAPTLTDSEQYLLELVNRAREDPGAETARYGIGLNDGLAPGTISNTTRQPLAPQQSLITAARLHSQDMLDRNYFDHTTQGAGTTFDQRVTNQGYIWNRVAENIGYSGKTYNVSQTQFIDEIHEGLIRSAGHRENIMDPDLDEAGIGARFGSFHPPGDPDTYPFTAMVTEDFGSRNLNACITGVVYTDSDGNNFYTIGESIRSGSVSAVNVSSGAVFSDTIGVSGAYGFVVPAGTYSVSARFTLNGSTQVVQKQGTFLVGASNVKVDFETTSASLVPVSLSVASSVNSVNETGALTVATMTVTRSGDLGSAVTVNLASSDTTEITVPVSILMPAGQSQVTFAATAVNDGVIDGTQTSTITVTVSGYTSGSRSLSVVDRTYPSLPLAVQTVATARPTFTWSGISNAATYEVYVNNVTTGETRVVNTTGISTTGFTTTVDLPIGTFYVWVRGFTSSGLAGPWSPTSVWNLRPTATITNSGRTESGSLFTIEWSRIPGASSYDVWIDRLTSGPSQYLRNTTVPGNSLTVSFFDIGRYGVWVRGRNTQGDLVNWSSQAIINVSLAVTGQLITATDLNSVPTLSWSAVGGANRYDVWINNLTTGASAVVRNTSVSGTSLVLGGLSAASYRAWVRARDVNGAYYVWSSAFEFEVQRAPRVTSPFENSQPPRPLIVWTAVAGASRYEIWLANLTNNTIVVNDPGLSTTSFTPAADLTAGTYRVWIRAFDSSSTASAWSLPVTFAVASNAGTFPVPEQQPGGESALERAFASADQWLAEPDLASRPDPDSAAGQNGPLGVESGELRRQVRYTPHAFPPESRREIFSLDVTDAILPVRRDPPGLMVRSPDTRDGAKG